MFDDFIILIKSFCNINFICKCFCGTHILSEEDIVNDLIYIGTICVISYSCSWNKIFIILFRKHNNNCAS